jgi:hypothetical protein
MTPTPGSPRNNTCARRYGGLVYMVMPVEISSLTRLRSHCVAWLGTICEGHRFNLLVVLCLQECFGKKDMSQVRHQWD